MKWVKALIGGMLCLFGPCTIVTLGMCGGSGSDEQLILSGQMRHVKTRAPAMISPNAFEKAAKYANQGDDAAFTGLILTGEMVMLDPGTVVYVEDYSVVSHRAKVRIKGQQQTYYVLKEYLE